MIARYSRPEMVSIWSEDSKFKHWIAIEREVCRELAKRRVISRADAAKLEKAFRGFARNPVDAAKIARHELKTKHDVLAFTTALAERMGRESRFIHFGLTSSDVIDTGFSLQIIESWQPISKGLKALLQALKKIANRYQMTPTIGRSHGMFAEPTSFGLKFLGFYAEIARDFDRMKRAIEGARYGKLSGAVGVMPHWNSAFEISVLKHLGLKPEPVATQVIPRDRHAEVLLAAAQVGASIERIAVELRHLQRSEVGEVIEGFSKGQKGSSAMPHKRNPISSENLTGCARMLRAYAGATLENVPLWHERDISHSSVERVFFPDGLILLDYMIARMTRVLEDLGVNESRIRKRVEEQGALVFSGHVLLALVEKGATREEAYQWIQAAALESLNSPTQGKDFLDRLAKNPLVAKYLKPKDLKAKASLRFQLGHVRELYRRTYQVSARLL